MIISKRLNSYCENYNWNFKLRKITVKQILLRNYAINAWTKLFSTDRCAINKVINSIAGNSTHWCCPWQSFFFSNWVDDVQRDDNYWALLQLLQRFSGNITDSVLCDINPQKWSKAGGVLGSYKTDWSRARDSRWQGHNFLAKLQACVSLGQTWDSLTSKGQLVRIGRQQYSQTLQKSRDVLVLQKKCWPYESGW